MKKIFLINLLSFCCYWAIQAQSVYVDSNIGNDNNAGTEKSPIFSVNKAAEIISRKDNNFYTIKINPGIYILDKHVSIATEKLPTNKRIVIEASILPDDSTWTPEKMPVIISKSKTGEIMSGDDFLQDNWITSFYVDESRVTIRGIKFLGYSYPKFFYPIARFNKSKKDLVVEQCMFLGDLQASVIQSAIIAEGDSVKVDHCIFYNANNSVVYWHSSEYGDKTGNSMTNCIIYGATGSAIFTYSQDKDFVFKNNIVSNCNIFWSKGTENKFTYSLDSCVIVNCNMYTSNGETIVKYPLNENNIIKEGHISLRLIEKVWKPLPIDHLHVIPNTLGYNLNAGIFKNQAHKKTDQ